MRNWMHADAEISQIVETERNANVMTGQEYRRLKSNIRKSGMSTALTCWRRASDGKYVILGGNHRYRACLELRMKRVPVQYVEEQELSRDERIALQLSLNSVHGTDNKGILRRLFEEIQNLEFKEMANIDINEIKEVKLCDVGFAMASEHYSVCLILYRRDMEALDSLLELTEEQRRKNDLVILSDGSENEEEYLELMKQISKRCKVSRLGACFGKFLELARLGLERQSSEGQETKQQ